MARTKRAAKEAPAAEEAPPAAAPAAPKRRKAAQPAAAGKETKAAAAPTPAAGSSDGPALWLMKSEPDEFSLDDLRGKPASTSCWEGVRNPQARNFQKSMKLGDSILFYHSSCKVPAVVGIAEVARLAYPDHTQFDPKSKYYDPSSSQDAPKWHMVDVRFVRELRRIVSLEELKRHKEGALEGMLLLNRPRLSVQPVTPQQWNFILELEAQAEAPANMGAGGAGPGPAKKGGSGKAKAKGKAGAKAKQVETDHSMSD